MLQDAELDPAAGSCAGSASFELDSQPHTVEIALASPFGRP
jgi:hypothetical protein